MDTTPLIRDISFSLFTKLTVSSGSFDRCSIRAACISSGVPSKNLPQPAWNNVSPENKIKTNLRNYMLFTHKANIFNSYTNHFQFFWHQKNTINTNRLGVRQWGGILSQIDFPPVVISFITRQRFLNIQSGKRVLINIPKQY